MSELNKTYMVSDDVVVREIEGELIIIPISAGIADMEEDIFSLNVTGKAIWDKLDGHHTVGQVVDMLSEEFDSDRDLLLEDTLGLLGELLQRGILVEQ